MLFTYTVINHGRGEVVGPVGMSSWASFSSSIKKKKEEAPRQTSAVTRKNKDGNVGISSTFLGLKAELAEKKLSSKEKGKSDTAAFLAKPDRRLPAHLRPSPDVLSRSLKYDQRQTTTSSWANTPSSQLDAARRALEKKAAMYDKLKKGGTGGLNEQMLQDSLIDWDRKDHHRDDDTDTESDEEEEEEGSTPPIGSIGRSQAVNSDEDPMTEYEDEFGRMRRVRRSEVPRSVLRNKQKTEEDLYDEDLVSYGPSTSFPIYKPDPTAQVGREDYKRKGPDHFNAQFEKRYRGAGFYQFSQDEETRKKEMDAIRQDRDETEKMRAINFTGDEGQSIAERRRAERSRLVESKRREIVEKRKRLCEN